MTALDELVWLTFLIAAGLSGVVLVVALASWLLT
jgi:hypothetical protein